MEKSQKNKDAGSVAAGAFVSGFRNIRKRAYVALPASA